MEPAPPSGRDRRSGRCGAGGSRADSEATGWLDKMMGPDAELHREAFDEWLAKPGNGKAYEEARDNWNWAGDMSTARIAADVRADAREREPGGRRWAFATILAAVIAVGFAWYLVGRDSDRPIIASNSAQGESQLADGTRVTLMDGARIETRFSDGERRVILHDGRARFEVAHDASRPFLVEAGDSVTRALGTIFEVDLRADVPRIALVEGSVEVRRLEGGKALRLRPGERAEVRASLTYYDVDYRDRIGSASEDYLRFLVDRESFAGVVTENPAPSVVQGYFNSPLFFNPFGFAPDDIVAILDGRTRNLSAERQRGIDFDVGYAPELSGGTLDLGIAGTHRRSRRQG